ncbi:MAG: tetratricopeptide repeat protein [Ignavibacteriae bacterium]|nr:tetratricopeptide repeat protein [Ignavibacteriota bacterium]
MKKDINKGSQKKPKQNFDKAGQLLAKPMQKSGIEQKPKQESVPTGSKFEWNFRNPKFRSSLLFLMFVIFFLFIWKEPEVKSIDPWYEGYFLVDSSMKVSNPQLKKDLLNQGGNKLRELVKEYPYHSKVHLLLGIYYEVSGKWDSAIAEHRESMRLGAGGTINPIEQDAKRQLLICYLNKSNQQLQLAQYSEARKTIDEAIAQNLNHPDLDNQIGIIFHRQAMLDSAEYYYNKVISVVPNHQSASANLGAICFIKGNNLLKANKTDQAILMYQRAVSLAPKNSDAFINLGYVYTLQNKLDDAAKSYQKALEIKPDNKFAISGLINVYKRKGDIRMAESLSKQYGLNQ